MEKDEVKESRGPRDYVMEKDEKETFLRQKRKGNVDDTLVRSVSMNNVTARFHIPIRHQD
jgi:hypothetical protein